MSLEEISEIACFSMLHIFKKKLPGLDSSLQMWKIGHLLLGLETKDIVAVLAVLVSI